MNSDDPPIREPAGRDVGDIFERMAEEWERFPGVSLAEALESVGPGWQPLVDRAWHLITNAGGRVKQVKEKFAELRIYFDRVPELGTGEVRSSIGKIELASRTICEWCGGPGERRDREYEAALPPRTGHGTSWWYKTLCDAHAWAFYMDDRRWWDSEDDE